MRPVAGRIRPLTNTQREILLVIREWGPQRPEPIVRVLWPKTRQPEKKRETVLRHLRELERRGVLRECGGVWLEPRG